MWDFSWACVDAFSAANAFLRVYGDGGRFFVYRECFDWASFNARVIFTLRAQMREFCAWDQHEHSNP